MTRAATAGPIQSAVPPDFRTFDAASEREAEGRTTGVSAVDWAWTILQHRSLIGAFFRRDLEIRYRGSFLGFGWMVIAPAMTAVIYTYAMGVVMGARFPGAGDMFASGLSIYLGVIAFQLVADVLSRSPDILHEQSVFVKKSVVPLRILPIYPIATALTGTAISLVILAACCLASGKAARTLPLVPLAFIPLSAALAGMAWGFAAVGAHVRDVKHFIGFLMTFLLFASPVLYPSERVPSVLRPILSVNPLGTAIETARSLAFGTAAPSPGVLAIHVAACLALAVGGYAFFRRAQPEFADVV